MNEYQNIRVSAFTAHELRDVRDTLRVAVRLRPDVYPGYLQDRPIGIDETVQYLIESAVERLPTFFPEARPATAEAPSDEEAMEAVAVVKKPRKRK